MPLRNWALLGADVTSGPWGLGSWCMLYPGGFVTSLQSPHPLALHPAGCLNCLGALGTAMRGLSSCLGNAAPGSLSRLDQASLYRRATDCAGELSPLLG